MNSKFSIILITALMFGGCASQKDINVPSVKNIKDVKLGIDSDGDVAVEKTHSYEDGSETAVNEKISDNKYRSLKGFEKVPNFEKDNTNNIIFKEKENKKERKIVIKKGEVKVSVESIPLNEFVDLVFGNVLKLNYTVSEKVRSITNPITLNMSETQSKQQVFEVVKKLLSMEGVDIKKENGVLFIDSITTVKSKDVSSYIGYGKTVDPKILDTQEIVQFVPFQYIEASKARNLLIHAGVSRSVGYLYPTSGISMMKGKAGEIRKAIEVIRLIDRPYMSGKTPYLFEFKNIDVGVFRESIERIFNSNGIETTTSPKGIGILLSPIVSINSMLVISPKEEWIDMFIYWKNKLDIESNISKTPKLYIYKVKNRKADDLAKSLSEVIKLKLNSEIQAKKGKVDVSKEINNNAIFADLPTNTIMMNMLPSDYRKIMPLIKQLDALPLQVLVEVTLAEVTLTDTFSLGFEHAIKNNAAVQNSGSFNNGLSDIVNVAFGGSGFGATYASEKIESVINSYAEDKLLSILSKPKILILNNETGNINVGTQVPVVSSELSASDVSSSQPTINRNIKYQNTGVQLGLTPTINSNGILTVNISLTLSEAQLNSTSNIDSPLIVNRSLSTSLSLKSNSSVLLGGLISKNKSSTDSGVPLLMDIPVLGTVFKGQSDKITKTELVILIKPVIIESVEELDEKTTKYKELLGELKEYSLL